MGAHQNPGLSLSIEREWSQLHEAALAPSMIAHPVEGLADIERSVDNGRAAVFTLYRGSERIGSAACMIQAFAGGREFVIVAAGASNLGRSLIPEVLPTLEEFAVENGCDFVRVHTRRPGLVRRLTAAGYDAGETVLRKRVV